MIGKQQLFDTRWEHAARITYATRYPAFVLSRAFPSTRMARARFSLARCYGQIPVGLPRPFMLEFSLVLDRSRSVFVPSRIAKTFTL